MMLSLLTAMATTPMTLSEIAQSVEKSRLKSTVERLAAFHTRNSLSPGIQESCQWVADQLKTIPGLEVEVLEYKMPAGRRVPKDTTGYQVVATLKGKTSRTLIVGGHLDSLNLQVDPVTGRAPGANDDASGVALTMELARIACKQQWNQTIKFVAFSGEEQGLLGSTALAKRAKEEKWGIEAVLSNDTVGSSSNLAGQTDKKQVRVFSEEGETHSSRELARMIEWTVRQNLKGFGIKLVFRRDRFGRGGDHTPFVVEGYSAVRFVEVHEEYTRQHTPDDLPEHMDFDYLRNVARSNIIAIASLADAAPAPTNVRVVRDQSHDTSLTWKGMPGVKYVVFWRETTSPIWQKSMVIGEAEKAKIKLVNKDDHIFAVAAEGGIPVEAE